MQIMELLWSAKEPMTFRQIMDVAINEWKKTWKVQTLNTFLNGLQKMKLIRAEQSSTSPYNVYYPYVQKSSIFMSGQKRWWKFAMEIHLAVL